MMESESNSKSNPWDNSFEAFQLRFESFEEWYTKINKFDRLNVIAETRGKTVSHQTYITDDGEFITDVICH
jgi:hypothetical protein